MKQGLLNAAISVQRQENNMQKNEREALRAIESDLDSGPFPVTELTTSKIDNDISSNCFRDEFFPNSSSIDRAVASLWAWGQPLEFPRQEGRGR